MFVDPAIRREFAARLRAMREYADVDKADIARMLGMKIETDRRGNRRSKAVDTWEDATSDPGPAKAQKIANWLESQALKNGRWPGVMPSSFLWPITDRPSLNVPEAVMRQRVGEAMSAILDLQGLLPPEDSDEQSQSGAR